MFFSTAGGTSHYVREPAAVSIRSLTGEITFRKITFRSHGLKGDHFRVELPGNRTGASVRTENGDIVVEFDQPCTIKEGETLKISGS